MRTKIWMALVLGLLVCAGPLAADGVVHRGIDLFTTIAGSSFYDFSPNPIPAGFFCEGSPAFDGRIDFQGVPLVTAVPGQLRGADTVVERLDDAVFDDRGAARTRVRVRALSMVGTQPLQTPCGAFQVHVALAGPQRVTTMEVVRSAEGGGTFRAPLDIRARIEFVPMNGPRSLPPLAVTGSFTLPSSDIAWSYVGGPGFKQVGPVVVDTDGDQVPDTRLRGTSNFAAGWAPGGETGQAGSCTVCEPEVCHSNEGHLHCTGYTACWPNHCP